MAARQLKFVENKNPLFMKKRRREKKKSTHRANRHRVRRQETLVFGQPAAVAAGGR